MAFALAQVLILVHVCIVTHAFRVHCGVRPSLRGLVRIRIRWHYYVLIRWRHRLTVVLYLSFEVLWAHGCVDKVRLIAPQFTIICNAHDYILFWGFCGHRHALYPSICPCLLYHCIMVLFDCLCQLFVLDAQIFIRSLLLNYLWAILWRCKLELLGRAYKTAWHHYIAIAICVNWVLGHLQWLAMGDRVSLKQWGWDGIGSWLICHHFIIILLVVLSTLLME